MCSIESEALASQVEHLEDCVYERLVGNLVEDARQLVLEQADQVRKGFPTLLPSCNEGLTFLDRREQFTISQSLGPPMVWVIASANVGCEIAAGIVVRLQQQRGLVRLHEHFIQVSARHFPNRVRTVHRQGDRLEQHDDRGQSLLTVYDLDNVMFISNES